MISQSLWAGNDIKNLTLILLKKPITSLSRIPVKCSLGTEKHHEPSCCVHFSNLRLKLSCSNELKSIIEIQWHFHVKPTTTIITDYIIDWLIYSFIHWFIHLLIDWFSFSFCCSWDGVNSWCEAVCFSHIYLSKHENKNKNGHQTCLGSLTNGKSV